MNTFAGDQMGESVTVQHLREEIKAFRATIALLQGRIQERDNEILRSKHEVEYLEAKIMRYRASGARIPEVNEIPVHEISTLVDRANADE